MSARCVGHRLGLVLAFQRHRNSALLIKARMVLAAHGGQNQQRGVVSLRQLRLANGECLMRMCLLLVEFVHLIRLITVLAIVAIASNCIVASVSLLISAHQFVYKPLSFRNSFVHAFLSILNKLDSYSWTSHCSFRCLCVW